MPGEVVERGDTRQIFNSPRHPYTARLLECDPARQEERSRSLPTIPGEIPDLRRRPQGCVFEARCDVSIADCAAPPPEAVLDGGHRAKCFLASGEAAQ